MLAQPLPLPPKEKAEKGGPGKGKGKGKPSAAAAVSAAAVAVSILRAPTSMVVPGSVAIVAVATARSDRPDATARSVGLAATAMPTEGYRSWLLDTGCRYDLTTRSSVPEHLQGMILPAPVKITLATANDLAYGTQIVRQQIGEFGETAEPYILDCSLDVLSIGRRCVEDGYRFVWEPYSLHPTMTTAAGKGGRPRFARLLSILG